MRGKAGKARTTHGVDAARPRGTGPRATSAWPTAQVQRVAWGRTLLEGGKVNLVLSLHHSITAQG